MSRIKTFLCDFWWTATIRHWPDCVWGLGGQLLLRQCPNCAWGSGGQLLQRQCSGCGQGVALVQGRGYCVCLLRHPNLCSAVLLPLQPPGIHLRRHPLFHGGGEPSHFDVLQNGALLTGSIYENIILRKIHILLECICSMVSAQAKIRP